MQDMPEDVRYARRRVIGSGGQGTVWLAEDVWAGGFVALKILNRGTVTDESLLRKALLEEAALHLRLASMARPHPNIVHIIDIRPIGGDIAIVMEYVDGESVREKIHKQQKLPPAEALEIALQVCEGLAVAHEQGIIHRDIKPANLLIRKADSTVKIIDWGVAKNIDAAGPGHTFTGTFPFMSPEVVRLRRRCRADQLRSLGVDRRADIYSLGVSLFQMLTATLPFDPNKGQDIMEEEILAGVGARQEAILSHQGFDATLISLVLKAMARDAVSRFPSAFEFREAILKYIAEGGRNNLIANELDAAWQLYSKRDDCAAERKFQEVIARFPNHPEGFLQFARFYIQSARDDDAIGILTKGIEKVPGTAAFWSMRGRLYAKRNSPLAYADLVRAKSLGVSEKEALQIDVMLKRLPQKPGGSGDAGTGEPPEGRKEQ